jgi:hypothetical protein
MIGNSGFSRRRDRIFKPAVLRHFHAAAHKKWLETKNIAGRVYVMPHAAREFTRRMAAGEFAKEHVAPKKKKTEPPTEFSHVE